MSDSAGEFPAAPWFRTLLFSAGFFPAALRRLEIAFFCGLVSCCDLRALSYSFQRVCFLLCLNKKVRLFNVCLISKRSFKMRDSAGEFPAAPYLYFTVFIGFVSCCLNKKFRIFNVCLFSKSLFKIRDSAGEFPAAPYLYFTVFSGFVSCCLNKKVRIFNVCVLS